MSDITVITGPMKSGKTKKLINLYNMYTKCGYNNLIFKPYMDNRFSNTEIVSRDNDRVKCLNIHSIEDIYRLYNIYGIDNIFIDEFQFINGNIQQLLLLKNKGINIFVCGLLKTSELKPFGLMPKVMNIANVKIYLTGICDICGNSSRYSYYKGDKTTDISIGDTEYLSLCKKCYFKLIRGTD